MNATRSRNGPVWPVNFEKRGLNYLCEHSHAFMLMHVLACAHSVYWVEYVPERHEEYSRGTPVGLKKIYRRKKRKLSQIPFVNWFYVLNRRALINKESFVDDLCLWRVFFDFSLTGVVNIFSIYYFTHENCTSTAMQHRKNEWMAYVENCLP